MAINLDKKAKMAQITILHKKIEFFCMCCGVYRVGEFKYAT